MRRTIIHLGLLLLLIVCFGGSVPQRTFAQKPINASSELFQTLQNRELMPGVTYRHLLTRAGNHSMHVLSIDRTTPTVAIHVIKAQERIDGLERLTDIAARVDSVMPKALKGIINANFWSSYQNAPIGPTVINGEVVQMSAYKQWSSCFFDRQHRMVIDRFTLSGAVRVKSGAWMDVQSVNRRHNASELVIYNHFTGATVPYSQSLSAEELEKELLANQPVNDDTEAPLSREAIKRAVNERKRTNNLELPLTKAVIVYTKPPAVNEETSCKVLSVDTGLANIPANGFVLSFPPATPLNHLPKAGDKLTVRFTTNTQNSIPFINAVSGTPRLVRNGIASHEAAAEGTISRRFIKNRLRRTAIGTDASGNMLYFVVVEGAGRGMNSATLNELADCMKMIGAHEAMNLDGGGSTTMVVSDSTGTLSSAAESGRKISLGLGVMYVPPKPLLQDKPRLEKKLSRTNFNQ